MQSPLRRVAIFLFFSGACALVYQIAWFRELRLIFGGSTAASSAVMAVFMGGLGIGGLLLGRRADKSGNAFALYANLELIVAGTAALSPLLVWLAQKAYIAIGGSSTLGSFGATVVRLLLTVIVLGPSTFAMGGTMPAAARAVERAGDVARNRVAVLYGVNTMGAVAGTLAANFALIEIFGIRMTLWIACLINALVAMGARAASRRTSEREATETSAADADAATDETREDVAAAATARWFPPVAAASAGFAFMLAELVWYRMLGPLLGGSSYTFGLILAVALAGIGIGGAIYSFGTRRVTFGLFALTCALEALAIAIPFALGDRIALFALLIGGLAHSSFAGSILAWSLVTFVVVFPAAVVAGYQFPAIIALYGTGKEQVGSDVGRAYVANTAGSIAGSLAGGFGLLPLLTAPGSWKLAALLLVVTAAGALALDLRARGRAGLVALVSGGATAILAVVCLAAEGPTAAWRHSGIGANRAGESNLSKSDMLEFRRRWPTSILWEEDGLESSVAINHAHGYGFVVNGKGDGHVIADRGTQVMSGMVGALVHSNAKTALVVGLGTGSTAGWLGSIPSMERVDVMELEPAILRVARDCKAVNQNVMDNPKVHITLGDAREGLLTSRTRYDVVFSEPSNPYRAGISSLYTLEYYSAVAEHLTEDGVFVQWVQTYDVDPFTVGTAIVTLRTAYPSVSLWQTEEGDLLLVAQRKVRPLDLDRLRVQLGEEPYLTASTVAWGTSSVEGMLSHFVAAPGFADVVVANQLGIVNHDDENALEFAFARGVGSKQNVGIDLKRLARRLNLSRPLVTGTYDEDRVVEERMIGQASNAEAIYPSVARTTPPQTWLANALRAFMQGEHTSGLAEWNKRKRPPANNYEAVIVGSAMALVGDERLPQTLPLVPRATDRTFIEALWLLRKGKSAEGLDLLAKGFVAARNDPWTPTPLMMHALHAAQSAGAKTPAAARTLLPALAEPFAASTVHFARLRVYVTLAGKTGDPKECVQAFDRAGNLPYEDDLLEARATCYEKASDPRAAAARQAVQSQLALTPVFGGGVPVPPAAPSPALSAAPSAAPAAGSSAAPAPSPPPSASAP